MLRSFSLPDVGEGLTEAEVLAWRVGPGDHVNVNELLCEVETAKAAVELPSPFEGTVVELKVPVGALVPVGTELITIEVAEGETAAPAQATVEAQVHREPVLVGYGTTAESGARRKRVRPGDVGMPAVAAAAAAPAVVPPVAAAAPAPAPQPAAPVAAPAARTHALAAPPVRGLAKSLGVDLDRVAPTGPDGIVTRADVEAAAQGAPAAGAAAPLAAGPELVAERIPVRGVLRSMADAMVRSAFTAPHVTEWVTVDVTRSVELVARMRAHPAFAGIKVTPLTLVAAALIRAARRNPRINGSWHEAENEIVLPDRVDLGIAVASPRGLLVPHVPRADRLSLPELARALEELVDVARAGKATPEQLTGGTITITNVGVFGVDGGTPIINPGQAAILAVGQIAPRPWVVTDAAGAQSIAIRQVMELTLSFDHRMVDGAIGSQALSDVATFLSDPALHLLLP